MKTRTPKRTTTPEEEGIELYDNAMEITERAIKAAFRTGHVSKDAVKKTVAAKRRKTKRAAQHSSSTNGNRN
jgi:hypothetical protein